MVLIVGLGNPGEKYKGTRHNVGFEVVGGLAERWGGGWSFSKKAKADFAKVSVNGIEVELLKPMDFMNNSGFPVRYALKNHEGKVENVYLIHDDVDLDLGRLKIQVGGGAAGHHGVESVIRQLTVVSYQLSVIRFRLGIGKPGNDMKTQLDDDATTSWVLEKFIAKERKVVDEMVERCGDAVEAALTEGMEMAMNRYN